MKLTKLSYFLIYLSYVLETYLCIAMGNPTSIQQLILTILWAISIIIHFTITVYFEKLYSQHSISFSYLCLVPFEWPSKSSTSNNRYRSYWITVNAFWYHLCMAQFSWNRQMEQYQKTICHKRRKRHVQIFVTYLTG